MAYPLSSITYCAHCERLAVQQDDSSLRTRLTGSISSSGVRRYRHQPGVACGITNRSVICDDYEADLERLIHLLDVNVDMIDIITEMAIQMDQQLGLDDEFDLEAKKQEAITLCQRRINAAIVLFGDGHIDRQEYERRVEKNEREISYWQARTTETEKIAVEIAMCIEAVKHVAYLWKVGSDEARKGIRDVEEWYASTVLRPDYVRDIFERQCAIALENLPRIFEAVGNRVTAVWISGTDFGAQNGPLISPRSFRDLFKPFYTQINTWIREHTQWHRFVHSCGSIVPLIPDLIDAGFDILNPVQTTANNMASNDLKQRFSTQLTFWGGGVDTQHILPFGTPDQVREDVRQQLDVFAPGGGFVFNPIHNVQAQVPVENLLAMYETVRQ